MHRSANGARFGHYDRELDLVHLPTNWRGKCQPSPSARRESVLTLRVELQKKGNRDDLQSRAGLNNEVRGERGLFNSKGTKTERPYNLGIIYNFIC